MAVVTGDHMSVISGTFGIGTALSTCARNALRRVCCDLRVVVALFGVCEPSSARTGRRDVGEVFMN
jgi:hypothetical protein